MSGTLLAYGTVSAKIDGNWRDVQVRLTALHFLHVVDEKVIF